MSVRVFVCFLCLSVPPPLNSLGVVQVIQSFSRAPYFLLFYCLIVLLFYCSTVLLFYCSSVLLFYLSSVYCTETVQRQSRDSPETVQRQSRDSQETVKRQSRDSQETVERHPSSIISHWIDCLPLEQGWISQHP